VTNVPLVLLLGIISAIQTHLAKALERQGIEVFDQLRAKLQRDDGELGGGLRKPAIYTAGLILNHTVFVWSILAQPHGPPALFSSMFGIGLVFLMVYARIVLKERISRLETAGAGAILTGTLIIGIENISRAEMDRFGMDLAAMFVVLGAWLILSLASVVAASRSKDLGALALSCGLLAGGLGSLDPFFKGVGQNYGGQPGLLPSSTLGAAIFGASFVLGFLAFLVTQVAFAKKVRASLLVPASNAAYIGLPILLQIFLLPKYALSLLAAGGLVLILAGILGMHVSRRRARSLLVAVDEEAV
jgi:drug/metabolite transporter (DMT)-like permease